MTSPIANPHSMSRKATRNYLILSLTPFLALFVCSLIGAFLAQRHIYELIDSSMRQLGQESKTYLLNTREEILRSQARDVAEQINLIINSHPGITVERLQQSPLLRKIAIQRVGLTGYTCLYEAETGIMRIHPNPRMNNHDMKLLAEKLPSWWRIFETSLSGSEISNYYDWLEEDGRIIQKFMTMTPVATPVDGRRLMVAATTYLDEFLDPVHFTASRAESIATAYREYVSHQGWLIVALMAVILLATLMMVVHFGRRAVAGVVVPIRQLAEAAAGFGDDLKAPESPSPLIGRPDEIGELARALARMRSTIADQFKRLKTAHDRLWETQQALSESEAHYRSLFEKAPIGIYRMQPDGTPIDVNPALVAMLGYPDKQTLLSRPRAELYVDPKDRGTYLAQAAAGQPIHPWELRMRRFDGGTIWVLNEAAAMLDQDGNVTGYLGAIQDITQLQAAQEALWESERNFRMLIEHAPIAIFCMVEGRFEYLNSAALRIFKAETPEQLHGRSIMDFVPADFAPTALERMRILLREREAVPDIEHDYLRLDGSVGTVDTVAVPFKYRGQDAILVQAREITEQKRERNALRASEQRFRTAFENAAVGMALASPEGTMIEANAALAEMLGYEPSELQGTRGVDFTHPDDLGVHFQVMEDLLNGRNGSGVHERRLLHRNGAYITVRMWASLQRDAEGRALHLIVIVQDITAHRKAEEELRLARFCIEHASVEIYRVAEDATILDVNEESCRSLGYDRQELLGKKVYDIDPTFSPEIWKEHFTRLARDGVQVIQAYHQRKDGTRFPIEVTANYFERGGRGFSFSFVRDISDRITAEQEREKLEGQLRQAQKMEAIGTLAGGVAHDFNNILSVIIGNAGILQYSGTLTEDQRGSLNQILAAGDRAKQLVKQILTFSRRGEQQRLLVNLRPVVKESFNFLKVTLPTSIDVRQKIEANVGAIMADPTQMQQVIMNLCTNAAHAMEDRESGVLEIGLSKALLTEEDTRFEPDVSPGPFVKISVSDTGRGMEPRVLEHLFEPYFTTKGPGKGTGLGLSVVHGIVKGHGGFIKVYSEVEKGTTFTVFLPLAPEGTAGLAAAAERGLPKGSETILLVDDEKVLVDMGQHMLRQLGYQVETRTSPLEAIEAFRASPAKYDAVVTDMTMPQMNGLNLSKKLLEIRPDLPILLCTGFSDMANEEKARAAGIREFAYKPLTLSDLAKTLRRMIDGAAPDKNGG